MQRRVKELQAHTRTQLAEAVSLRRIEGELTELQRQFAEYLKRPPKT